MPVHACGQRLGRFATPSPRAAFPSLPTPSRPVRYDLNAFPYNIAAWPTETILKGTRKVIPPVAGVDITPIVWVAIISFFSEILLGPQGLLTIIQKKGGF
jgi:hypothetical protein